MAIIKTLKDKLGNIVYPQTLVTGVYDSSGTTLDTLIGQKMGVVASATAGNLPTLTADGQLVDSGKKIDEVGGGTEDFIITLTLDGDDNYTCDKTSAEINAAYAAGKTLVCLLNTNNAVSCLQFSLTLETIYQFSYVATGGGTYCASIITLTLDCGSSDVVVNESINHVLIYESPDLNAEYANQFRSNIGAGTSDFSGSYNDLTDKPSVVPTSRTINGKALSSNITLSASDVGALPSTTTIPTIHSGTTDPSATLGSDGDIYIKYTE